MQQVEDFGSNATRFNTMMCDVKLTYTAIGKDVSRLLLQDGGVVTPSDDKRV